MRRRGGLLGSWVCLVRPSRCWDQRHILNIKDLPDVKDTLLLLRGCGSCCGLLGSLGGHSLLQHAGAVRGKLLVAPGSQNLINFVMVDSDVEQKSPTVLEVLFAIFTRV